MLIQNDTPLAEYRKADTLWIDTKDGANTPKRWDGLKWIAITDKAAQDAADAAVALATRIAVVEGVLDDMQVDIDNAVTTAGGKNKIVRSHYPAPSGPHSQYVAGDVWWQYGDNSYTGPIVGSWQYSGSGWVPISIGSEIIPYLTVDKLVATGGAKFPVAVIDTLVGDTAFLESLVVDTVSIADGAITAPKLKVGSIQVGHFAEDTSEAISTEITSATGELGSSLSSEFTEAIDSLPFSDYTPVDTFNTRTGDIDTAISAAEQAAADNLNAVRTELDEQIESINTTLAENKLYIDINPTDGIRLGHIDNNLNVQITNDRLSFLEGNTEVAYISNQKLYITTAEVTDQLVITRPGFDSSFYFDPRENGNLSFRFRSN